MKKFLIPALAILLTVGVLYAQSSVPAVGCDGVVIPCTWLAIFKTMRTIIGWALGLAVIYAFFRIMLLAVARFMQATNPNARKELTTNIVIILLAALAFVGLLPMTSYALKLLKVNPTVVQVVDCLQSEKYCAGLLNNR